MKKFRINVDGSSYEVEVEEVKDETKRPTQNTATKKSETSANVTPIREAVVSEGQIAVEAPMPGTVLRIEVSEGEIVKSGDVLLILEAMKMENEILAPKDGRVASIPTSVGTNVSKDDKLVIIE